MDQAKKRGLARLLLRWPERRSQLRLRFTQDPRLVELCEAYDTACEAASYWSKSADEIGPVRAREYQSLATDTEHDILIRLS